MVIEKLKKTLEEKGEVEFKIYSLDYRIVKTEDKVSIFPILYSNKKKVYNTIDEALAEYTIYNESIIENVDRIILK